MFKKIGSIVALCLLSVFAGSLFCACSKDGNSALPSTNLSNNNTTYTPSEGLTYELSADKKYYTVNGIGQCHDERIVIPYEYRNIPVTKIGKNAFKDKTYIDEIVLPDSILAIEDRAFYNCTSLKSVNLPNDVTEIGNFAFYNCRSLPLSLPKNLSVIGDYSFSYTLISTVNLSNHVEKVGDFAFYHCTNLSTLTLSENTEEIGTSAFADCYRLTEVNLASVQTIKQEAFSCCNALTILTIPSKTKVIGKNAFYRCNSLSSAIFADSNNWSDESGNAVENLATPESAAKFLITTSGAITKKEI